MNWNSKDIGLYLQEKDYIDTAVIPMMSIKFDEKMKQSAEEGEFIQLLSFDLERQFKGRMMFFPPFTYVESLDENTKLSLLKQWGKTIGEKGFPFVFYLTSDQAWVKHKENIDGTIFYVPSVPLVNMDDTVKRSVMEDQVKILTPQIVRGWQKNL